MKNAKLIADKLFPDVLNIEEIENKYPERNLPADKFVTRAGPSPTGFMHLGILYTCLIDERLAHQTEGIFYLRIEDTDQKREVEGATKVIVDSLKYYGIMPDEGEVELGKEVGSYGPYKQSARLDIYRAYVKWLVENNLAYPCFATSEELEKITNEQEIQKIRPGYRGQWAIWRDKNDEEILAALEARKTFGIRFRSNGNFENKIKVFDMVRGQREMSENDLDLILLKSDGFPTYHFAHVVDDHLMKTTNVVRGDEWLSSLPIHLQLFQALGWTAPTYCHYSPIQKMDSGARRKLSKRKDPEANVQFFTDAGYLPVAIVEYLMNLLNSGFEDWRKANPTLSYREYKLEVKKFSPSGALFDLNKLDDISKNIVASLSVDEVYNMALEWALKYDQELAGLLTQNVEYSKAVFGIERGIPNGRKDIAKWSDVKTEIGYFFDEFFSTKTEQNKELLTGLNWDDVALATSKFAETYELNDDKDTWFNKMKAVATELGYATNGKDFKLEPTKYKGQVADIAKMVRVALTGKTNSPDLHQVMKVLGRERSVKRLTSWK